MTSTYTCPDCKQEKTAPFEIIHHIGEKPLQRV